MGVNGLWQLITPAGRRIPISTLGDKILAIDASIWLVQFVKAMRDEEGKMITNAHILGTFRRLCRLLFHRVRPVFVFDGGTPQIKYRTLRARRQIRGKAEFNAHRAAQKLLLNELKRSRLKNQQNNNNGKKDRNQSGDNVAKGFIVPTDRFVNSNNSNNATTRKNFERSKATTTTTARILIF